MQCQHTQFPIQKICLFVSISGPIMRDLLKKHRTLLTRTLECQYGLISELVALGVLNDRQKIEISSLESNLYTQNVALLDLLCDPNIQPELFHKFHLFSKALCSTHQSHIANFLCSTG